MKKAIFLIILGAVFFVIPEFAIVADITTKLLGVALCGVGLVTVCLMWLYRFQAACDTEVAKMRKAEAKRLLEERNTIVFYPSPAALKAFCKYAVFKLLPRLFGVCVLVLSLYLAVSFAWYYILPVLKYVAYGIGVLAAILLVICAIPTKNIETA
ncbi:MAG: hypothetical protein IJ770_05440 [Alphaproteobacteria bacterium]|nr:hypothetical protein [Alphaproteobacteria bacterium]